LCPWQYADALGVLVFGANELDLPAADAEQLLIRDHESWSGMTIREHDATVVVLNSAHPRTRQASTLMHELAHLVLDHGPTEVHVSESGHLLLSDYSDEQEDEADWLMGALLLPRVALLQHRSSGRTPAQIAATFHVSVELCQWRLRMTGVETQLRYRG
jgi:Zn-dependent peptidase ImmA (M78 family)